MNHSLFKRLIIIAGLYLVGILFVCIGFALLFPIKTLGTSAYYVYPSNIYSAVPSIALGIILLVAAFIVNVITISKLEISRTP